MDSATNEANDLRTRAVQYTDDILSNVQSILTNGISNFEDAQNTLMGEMNNSLHVVVESRKELGAQDDDNTYGADAEDEDGDGDLTLDLL